MTLTEINEEFLVRYNGRAGNGAPALDDYEKSVFLTHSQIGLVKQYYGTKNLDKASVEGSEKRRRDLVGLVKQDIIPLAQLYQDPSRQMAGSSSILANLPTDLLFILQEQVRVTSSDLCIHNTRIPVKPITHDQFLVQRKNPFKKPDKTVVWRMDISSSTGNNNPGTVELIYGTGYTINAYYVRYVKYPSPIILSNLTVIDPSLSIQGLSGPSNSELSDEMMLEIISRAVTLALVNLTGDIPLNLQMNSIT